VAEVDRDQEAALRRLRAAFGFVQILKVVDHQPGQEQANDEAALSPKGEEQPPNDRGYGNHDTQLLEHGTARPRWRRRQKYDFRT
jgi:hypothetical protein